MDKLLSKGVLEIGEQVPRKLGNTTDMAIEVWFLLALQLLHCLLPIVVDSDALMVVKAMRNADKAQKLHLLINSYRLSYRTAGLAWKSKVGPHYFWSSNI